MASSAIDTAPPPVLRRVGTALALLAAGQLLAASLILLAAAPVAAAVVAVALPLALTPSLIALWTVRARAPGGVTGADRVTLLRHLGTGALAAASVLVLSGEVEPRSWLLAALGAAAVATDAVDGPIARRTGTAGPIGARIDMEADAALILVLSVLAALVVGPWALAIGLMRYAYVAASWVRPALRRPLAFSQLRRVIGGLQGVALLPAVIPVVPHGIATVVAAGALVLLVVSFGRDVLALERAEARDRADGRRTR
ncbi:CDP-alcohol phosphatidyltransferase family protein [Brachybacterium sp. AOP43-C2-M15]|uniref:CDP-alcohol phosphatidyltransferase family protein n=1 Tax=Brachybacterium sp. AOP43-C2-M15 TaxID=3457661 RepID=UPI00403371EA